MSARWWSFILRILFVIFLNWYACTAVTYVDSTAIHALKEIYHEYKARNIQVIHHYHLQLCSLSETLDAQTQSGKWLDKFNSPHFFNLALWILLLSYVALMWSLFLMMSQPTRSYYYLGPYIWVAYGLWLRMDTKNTCYCETMCPKHINHFRFNNLDNWEVSELQLKCKSHKSSKWRERESSLWALITFAFQLQFWNLKWQTLGFAICYRMRQFTIWSKAQCLICPPLYYLWANSYVKVKWRSDPLLLIVYCKRWAWAWD